MIEHDFDVPFVADLALREKQIQQNYRPIIAIHKWFARRPGTLFRGIILSEFAPRNVFVCWNCGRLYESDSRKPASPCAHCGEHPRPDLGARRGTVPCRQCGERNAFPRSAAGPPRHRMFALEYHCTACRGKHVGRFFKPPDSHDLENYHAAEARLSKLNPQFIPREEIPAGDETDRLLRWGYRRYREMFNSRQLLGLELSCAFISGVADLKVRRALATNLSDLLRYQNMLCRYDTMALKSLDIFSVHGFPVGQIQCESNLLGIPGTGKLTSVGSGGWFNITEKFAKAKAYCERPFEIRHVGSRKEQVFIDGEWIGELRNGKMPPERRAVTLSCADARSSRNALVRHAHVEPQPQPGIGPPDRAQWLGQSSAATNRPDRPRHGRTRHSNNAALCL
jgi:putative DNA methylase